MGKGESDRAYSNCNNSAVLASDGVHEIATENEFLAHSLKEPAYPVKTDQTKVHTVAE